MKDPERGTGSFPRNSRRGGRSRRGSARSGGTAGATSPPPGVLTLEQAVALALQGNRDVRNTALEAGKAEDELRAFRVQGLPQFNVYAVGTQTLQDVNVRVPGGAFGDFPGVGPIPATDTEVTTPAGRSTLLLGQVSQPLTQLRSVSMGTRLKRANLEIAREQLRAKRQAVANDTRRAHPAVEFGRADPGDGRHAFDGPGPVRHLRPGPEYRQVGGPPSARLSMNLSALTARPTRIL
jgi:outer membrane efflux protein